MNFTIATGLEPIAPLILFLFIFLALKWIQRPRRDSENRRASPSDRRKSQDASMRKLLEALGLPEDALPPPVALPKRPLSEVIAPHPSSLKSELPKSNLSALSLDKQISHPIILKESSLVAPTSIQQVTQKQLQKSEILAQKIPKGDGSFPILQASLRDQDTIRRAIVLREILGLPKSLCKDC